MVSVVAIELAIELFVALALSFEVNSVQLTGNKELFCHNEQVQLKCTVPSGVLEWRMSPVSLPEKSRIFIRGYDSLNSELIMTWSGLTIRMMYVAANATRMESTAHFVAASEFRGMTITCSGQVEASMALMIADTDGELSAVTSVHLSVHKNSSETNLMLTWDEPSLSGRPSVDYYLVQVNKMEFNVTSPRAEVTTVLGNESLHITIRFSNCLELSPASKFNLSLYEDWSEPVHIESSPSTVPVSAYYISTSSSTRANAFTDDVEATTILNSTVILLSADEMAHCSTLKTPIFISALLGTFVLSSSCTLFFIFVILKVKATRINGGSTVLAKEKEPVYEDITTCKDKLHMCVNNAYSCDS